MKLEFIGRKNGGLDETSCIYITKGELLKAYDSDKKKAFHDRTFTFVIASFILQFGNISRASIMVSMFITHTPLSE